MILNKRGFTLIELLAAIVIMGALLLIGTGAYSTIVKNSKEKAFYTSVSQVIENVKMAGVQSGVSSCSYFSDGSGTNYKNIYVSVYLDENGNEKKSVRALMNNGSAEINTNDFSTTNIDDKSTWVSNLYENTADYENYKMLEKISKEGSDGFSVCDFEEE